MGDSKQPAIEQGPNRAPYWVALENAICNEIKHSNGLSIGEVKAQNYAKFIKRMENSSCPFVDDEDFQHETKILTLTQDIFSDEHGIVKQAFPLAAVNWIPEFWDIAEKWDVVRVLSSSIEYTPIEFAADINDLGSPMIWESDNTCDYNLMEYCDRYSKSNEALTMGYSKDVHLTHLFPEKYHDVKWKEFRTCESWACFRVYSENLHPLARIGNIEMKFLLQVANYVPESADLVDISKRDFFWKK